MSRVSAAAVNDHWEQLVHAATPHTATPHAANPYRSILTVGGHVQLEWELEFASVLKELVSNTWKVSI